MAAFHCPSLGLASFPELTAEHRCSTLILQVAIARKRFRCDEGDNCSITTLLLVGHDFSTPGLHCPPGRLTSAYTLHVRCSSQAGKHVHRSCTEHSTCKP
jgi:hypothetical protein